MPTLADLMMQSPEFPALEQKMVARIGNADNIEEAFSFYKEFAGLLPDWKFVFRADRGGMPGFAVNRTFSHGAAIRTLFDTPNVIVLDRTTLREMTFCDESKYPYDYSASFVFWLIAIRNA